MACPRKNSSYSIKSFQLIFKITSTVSFSFLLFSFVYFSFFSSLDETISFLLTIGTSISFFLNSIYRSHRFIVYFKIDTYAYIHTYKRSFRDLILVNISPSNRSFDKENKKKKDDDVYIIIN